MFLIKKGDKIMAETTNLTPIENLAPEENLTPIKKAFKDKKLGIAARDIWPKIVMYASILFGVGTIGLNLLDISQSWAFLTALDKLILTANPQGAIWNGVWWQSIINGLFLLVQAGVIAIEITALPNLYAAIRNGVTLHRAKQTEKFAFVENKKEKSDYFQREITYDEELQKTTHIINNVLGTNSAGKSLLEQAQRYRDEGAGILHRKYVLIEDEIRRHIRTCVKRLAELTSMKNSGWHEIRSTYKTTAEIKEHVEAREEEMWQIQRFFERILNNYDEHDPFFTTLLSEVKKHNIDKKNSTKKRLYVGVQLIPNLPRLPDGASDDEQIEHNSLMRARQALQEKFNNDLVGGNPKLIKDALLNYYSINGGKDNRPATKLEIGKTTEFITTLEDLKKLSKEKYDAFLKGLDQLAKQANTSVEEVLKRMGIKEEDANKIVNDIKDKQREADESVARLRENEEESQRIIPKMNEAYTEAQIILSTLRKTLNNAGQKKQNLNEIVKNAQQQLTNIGYNAIKAQEILNKMNETYKEAIAKLTNITGSAEQAEEELNKLLTVKADTLKTTNDIITLLKNATEEIKNIADTVTDYAQQASDNATKSKDAADRSEESATKAEEHEKKAADNARATEDIRKQLEETIKNYEQQLEEAIVSGQDIEKIKNAALDASITIGISKEQADKILTTMVTEAQKVKDTSEEINEVGRVATNSLEGINEDLLVADNLLGEIKEHEKSAEESATNAETYAKQAQEKVDEIDKQAKKLKEQLADLEQQFKDLDEKLKRATSSNYAELLDQFKKLQAEFNILKGKCESNNIDTGTINQYITHIRTTIDQHRTEIHVNNRHRTSSSSSQPAKSGSQPADKIRESIRLKPIKATTSSDNTHRTRTSSTHRTGTTSLRQHKGGNSITR